MFLLWNLAFWLPWFFREKGSSPNQRQKHVITSIWKDKMPGKKKWGLTRAHDY